MSGAAQRGFQVVEDAPTPPTAQQNQAVTVAMKFWLLTMQNIGNRAVIAVSHLFTAAIVASAWALFMWTLPNPTSPQLVGLGLYCLFGLAIEWVRRK
jgi:hypothetical protein